MINNLTISSCFGNRGSQVRIIIKNILIIFCFFCLAFTQNHWETAIYASDDWSYLVPNQEPRSNWNSLNYDDSFWLVNSGGFGYGDNDDGTYIANALSVYIRKTFSVEEPDKLINSVLHTDYDDGFVAYLNETEICRSSNLGNSGDFIGYDYGTNDIDHEAQLYQGLLPEYCFIDSLELSSLIISGENQLAIQVHNISSSSSDMSSNFFLSFGIEDESSFYGETLEWFQEPVTFDQSNLPIFIIDTYGEQIPDEPRIPAYLGIINNESGINHIDDEFNDYDGHITIERRGNSSQGQPKTPYRFETVTEDGDNNNVSLLGFPEENDWVLYAPWSDKTFIRNVLTYQLSNEMGRYASKTHYCELYLNSEYQGIYVLIEKIKRDNNRVDISSLNPDEIDGNDVTGGYILKFDWYYTGDNIGGFYSENGTLYNFHYPKPGEIVQEQENYIEQYMNNFENIMNSDSYNDPILGYSSNMDVDSFIDLIILQELSKNVDAYRLSTYIYKDKDSIDGRLIAGPIWDINHGYGNCDYGYTWLTENFLLDYEPTDDQIAFWWEILWQDETFKIQFSNRYTELRSTILSEENIFGIIDGITSYLGPAVDRNFAKWPILGTYVWPNYFVFNTYEEEINYLKTWTTDRILWMDSQVLNDIVGDINSDGQINILDIVIVINMILGFSTVEDTADINQDGFVNILDIVILADWILN